MASISSSGVRSRSGAAFVVSLVSVWTISFRAQAAHLGSLGIAVVPDAAVRQVDGSCPAETPSMCSA
jgi:hypothetical protein